MTQYAKEKPPLLPEWAFVVQFRAGTRVEQEQVEGRVEHVMSGQAARFSSFEDLRAFMVQVLASAQKQQGVRKTL